MSYFDSTLILLKEKKEPQSFMIDFNEKLKSINLLLEKDDYEIIVFNDSRNEEEKDPIELNKSMTDSHIIDLVCSWKGLGLLSYRHSDFKFQIGINYLTWDDKYINGFEISFAGKDLIYDGFDKQKDLILEVSKFINYEYIVGDIGNTSKNYISIEKSLEDIKEHILNNSFKIDSRTW